MQVSRGELLAYLDELLPAGRAAEVEAALRDSEPLRIQAAELLGERDAGAHTLADIWRRHRVGCPGVVALGEYLLGTLSDDWDRSVELHLTEVGCRFCDAELEDLRSARGDAAAPDRRRRFFESTVGVRPPL